MNISFCSVIPKWYHQISLLKILNECVKRWRSLAEVKKSLVGKKYGISRKKSWWMNQVEEDRLKGGVPTGLHLSTCCVPLPKAMSCSEGGVFMKILPARFSSSRWEGVVWSSQPPSRFIYDLITMIHSPLIMALARGRRKFPSDLTPRSGMGETLSQRVRTETVLEGDSVQDGGGSYYWAKPESVINLPGESSSPAGWCPGMGITAYRRFFLMEMLLPWLIPSWHPCLSL